MKKILEVSCNGLTNGGVQQVIMSIVRNLYKEYHFDILVFTKEKEYYDEEFLSYGGRIFRIPRKQLFKGKELDFYFRGLNIFWRTYKLLKENGPYHAIHCHNYTESAMCVLAAKLAGVKIRIVHSHNDLSNVPYSKSRLLVQKIYKIILNHFATVKIGCSRAATNYLFDSNSIVINNGIDLSRFKPTDNTCLEHDGTFNLLHVGNFSPQKNQLFLIDVMKQLVESGNNYKLTLVGGKSDYSIEVENRIKRYSLSDYVSILPPYTDIPEIMRESDLFLFPSRYEGLGIVLIEAQAVGLHCLVSNAIPPEADLGNIEYAKEDSVKCWSQAIESSKEKYAGKTYVDMSTYDIRNVIEKYRELYK